VTGVSPAMGVTSGHTSVTISGSSFTGVTSVKFGATDATTFTFVSDQQITAVTPAEPQGTVDVTVTTPAGTSVSSAADRYSSVCGQRWSGAATGCRQLLLVGLGHRAQGRDLSRRLWRLRAGCVRRPASFRHRPAAGAHGDEPAADLVLRVEHSAGCRPHPRRP